MMTVIMSVITTVLVGGDCSSSMVASKTATSTLRMRMRMTAE